MITSAFEPRTEDLSWDPGRRAEKPDRPEHPELTNSDPKADFLKPGRYVH